MGCHLAKFHLRIFGSILRDTDIKEMADYSIKWKRRAFTYHLYTFSCSSLCVSSTKISLQSSYTVSYAVTSLDRLLLSLSVRGGGAAVVKADRPVLLVASVSPASALLKSL